MAEQLLPGAAENSLPRNPGDAPPGNYVVVARRYRPQDFQQLVGQHQVSQALANAIATGRVGHAYLFTGARGVGKTSTARIFSKALNCVQGPTAHPCGVCDICQGVAAGEDVDVIEIDGASNRGIDEIRQLRANVNVRPSRARYKIYIIDEVHMLTSQAFNALLKTLEEPPEHVKFIFCTTEADKIPITVLSRCQRYDFAPLETKSILERLQLICQTEGVVAELEALQVLARRAAGSMRDSQSLLEQLLAFGGTKITAGDVYQMLGAAKSSVLAELFQAIAQRNAAAALAGLDQAVHQGADVGQLVEQLLGYVRDALAALVGCPPELYLQAGAGDEDQLRQTGEALGMETLLAAAQILDHTLVRMRQSTQVRILAEVALVRLCRLGDLEQIPQLIAQLQAGGTLAPAGGVPGGNHPAAARPAPAAPRPDLAPPRPAASPPPSLTPPRVEKKTTDLAPVVEDRAEAAPEPPVRVIEATSPAEEEPPADARQVEGVWRQVVANFGDMTGDCAAKFEGLAISGPNRLVVRFRRSYTQAKEFCEKPERRTRIEEALSQATGRSWRIDFDVVPDPPGAAPTTERAAPAVPPAVRRRQRLVEVARLPLVQQAMHLFGAEITDVRDPAPKPEGDEPPTAPPAAVE